MQYVLELLELGKHASKYCVGMEGNVSAKDGDTLSIKASGTMLSRFDKKDLVEYDFSGNQLSNFARVGSMELSFHSYLLQIEGINFISHTHPVNTLKILCSNDRYEFASSRLFPDQVIFNGIESCLVPYRKPGEELKNKIVSSTYNYLTEFGVFPKLILLENHGIIACGKTIDECMVITDICEKSAEVYLGAKALGNVNFLSENEINQLIIDKKELYRKSLI